ncbi:MULTISPECIES: RNase A-like domain-containing protein [unclassified Nocardioides]|uniref:RNase A-like domain-containing protein n=1 Tax=unclassified Nocardioides TaxID=2615069 RepID=UPI0009F12FFF|nr:MULTISPECIES: RNase A-like domain-containing protein [unclassified Nocardioides]GAW49854.1 uncharacterized protein PD653B2_2181 [Nocardioides sp. PD653-B2]GAW54610.1 uncharacterized protein PD653_2022 [Nocardioides sp. PD653]
MRVAIRGEGYSSAVEAFVSGNLLAARACETLCNRLPAYAGMAGDDATATDFAASYDEAAAEAVSALAGLVGGLGSLGHLAEASLANHLAADAESVVGAAYRPDAPPSRADDSVGLLVGTPPSSLGADSSSLPGWASVVLDFLEGVFWPDADTDRLRDAAASWRSAATSVSILTAHCRTALEGFEGELSPEIPLAVATTQDLRVRIDVVADQLATIATSCEAYADQVDAKRAEMLDLLEQLGIELGVGALVTGALSLLSGGLAAGAGTAAAGGRIAAVSRDLKVIVDALRVLNGSTSAGLRPVSATLRDSRSYLSRLVAARRTAMTERGSLRLGREYGFPRRWLRSHEHSGSHTRRDHIGRSDQQLRERLANESGPPAASTFRSEREAERAIEDAISRNRGAIDNWMASGRFKKPFFADVGYDIGRILVRDTGEIVSSTKVRLVLVKDSSMPLGWRLLTAFPDL